MYIYTIMHTARIVNVSQQSAQMAEMIKRVKKLLYYCVSQEDVIVNFQKVDTKLAVHSNTGYLNNPKLCSRAGGHFFMLNSSLFPPNNEAVLKISQIIKVVMLFTAEAELGTLFFST